MASDERKRKGAGGRTRRCEGDPSGLTRSEIAEIVRELAEKLAPADLVRLMEREAALRRRARGFSSGRLRPFGHQLLISLDCLRDHLDGRCPHIPFHTVSTLAAGVLYAAREIDLVPDFLAELGQLDDAAVMAVAHEIAADGVKRYCAWKGIPEAPPPAPRQGGRRTPAGRATARSH